MHRKGNLRVLVSQRAPIYKYAKVLTFTYSRATWGGQSESNLEAILAKGTTSGGYTNVGGQLGLSPVRDMYLSS